ncbi:MAG TPA: hypothetical protein VMV94_09335 [Phycisphaerae bacterium]|nr:hypothetical protein [Phycisphaerae bacterium]
MHSRDQQITLQPLAPFPARALLARRSGEFYIAQHCRILRSVDEGASWSHVTTMPRRPIRRLAEASRLGSRLLRHEVKALGILSDGSYVAADREGVYHAAAGEPLMRPSRIEGGGRPARPPMTITVGPDDRILWGEYLSKTGHNLAIRLYVSDDHGLSFQLARVFEGGSILHVHNLVYDERLRHYWVLTGDHDHEPGIGRLSADLEHFDWVAKGKQCYRAVEVFDFGDSLIYGTDSEREPNAVVRFDKTSGRVERLHELDGSCIYACQFGGLYVITTTVEVSRVNLSRNASIWVSRDGEHWSQTLTARKDRWHLKLFQFGSFVLPRGASDKEVVLFSGQALEGFDGKAFTARVSGPSQR